MPPCAAALSGLEEKDPAAARAFDLAALERQREAAARAVAAERYRALERSIMAELGVKEEDISVLVALGGSSSTAEVGGGGAGPFDGGVGGSGGGAAAAAGDAAAMVAASKRAVSGSAVTAARNLAAASAASAGGAGAPPRSGVSKLAAVTGAGGTHLRVATRPVAPVPEGKRPR